MISRIVGKRAFQPRFAGEVADRPPSLCAVAFELANYSEYLVMPAHGRSGDDTNARPLRVADNRIVLTREPVFDPGIQQLIARAVPSQLKDQLACTLDGLHYFV
jgi:hypothetical protein